MDFLSGNDKWRVEHGDSLTIMRTMPDESVDVTITDPPYNERTHKGARAKGGKLVADTTINFASLPSVEWFTEALRISRHWVLGFCAVEQFGLYEATAGECWVRAGIWLKVGAAPQFTGDRPATGAEGIAIAHRLGKKRWNGGGSHAVWSHGFAADEVGDGRVHPTQKPYRLMAELVRLFSDPDEIVFDPYCGSGTTGAAAVALGRRFIGIEQNIVHVETAKRRIQHASGDVNVAVKQKQGALDFGDK